MPGVHYDNAPVTQVLSQAMQWLFFIVGSVFTSVLAFRKKKK